jgi:hypothetical protein
MHVRPGTPTSESVLPMAEDAFRSCSPVELTREVLTSKFHMRLSDAAKFLGISEPRRAMPSPPPCSKQTLGLTRRRYGRLSLRSSAAGRTRC